MSVGKPAFEVDFSERPFQKKLEKTCNDPVRILLDRAFLDKENGIKDVEKILEKPRINFTGPLQTKSRPISPVCFDHPLGLWDSKENLKILKSLENYSSLSFIEYLIKEKLKIEEPSTGCMVVYSKRPCGLFVVGKDFEELLDWIRSPEAIAARLTRNFVLLLKDDNNGSYKTQFVRNRELATNENGPIEILIDVSKDFLESIDEFIADIFPHDSSDLYNFNKNHNDLVAKIIRYAISEANVTIDPLPTHAGLLIEAESGYEKVESMLFGAGLYPEIFTHDLWQIPTSYGSEEPSYYSIPSIEKMEKIFREYNGVE